ncbi:unnamed protein product [Ectocarpus sp. 6 AP-2014]
MKSALVRLGVIALLGGKCDAMGSGTEELDVENPGAVVLGETFVLEWESVGQKYFDVELFTDSSDCGGSAEPVDLCGKSAGCGDSKGDLNVVIPTSAGSGEHSILLSLHDDPDVKGCTGPFIASEEEIAGPEGAYLDVFALDVEDAVITGTEVTVEWDYSDGEGSTQERFDIELYSGAGCSGSRVADICGKTNSQGELIGCPDTAGDYDVVIPTDIMSGEYSIKVGVFGATSPSGCSPVFSVVATNSGVINTGAVGTDTVVPSPWDGYAFPKPACDPTIPVTVRYAASTQRVYFEHTDGTTGGCATLSDVLAERVEKNGTVKGPLYPLNPVTGEKIMNASQVTGHWLIEADLYVTNGVTLQLHGSASGGDCDALRIKSTDTEFFNLRGHGGSLDFLDTNITSWDTDLAVPNVRASGDYDSVDDDADPRSYISCISEIITDPSETCLGNAKNTRGECRMDIVRSEIGWLGYYGAEAYGLTWKVRGFCTDKSNPEIFDEVNTYGDVIDSNIHHLFYGLYTYGHLGGLWNGNLMHDNEWYGFDPHDDSDYLTIHNNLVWNNGKHGIIASKRCNHVSIQNNEVWNGGSTAAGIFLHRSSDSAIVTGNHIHDMQDSGLATLESFDILFSNNLIERCKYGVRLSLGAGNNVVYGNTFSDLSSYGFFTYIGSNEPDVPPYTGYRPFGISVQNNVFSTWHMGKLKEADTTTITGNIFENALVFEVDNSQDTTMTGNTYPDTVEISVKNDACFVSGSDLGDELGTPC